MALTDKLTAIGDAIRRKTGKSEPIPLSDMPEEICTIGDDLLSGACTKIYNDRIVSLRSGAFMAMTRLTESDFPNVKTIGSNTFSGCGSLSFVNLPKITDIWYANFKDCTALETLRLPKLNTIGSSDAFTNCSSLRALVLENEKVCTLKNADNFKGTPIEAGDGYIYVPAALVEQYKATPNWSNFASQIRAIEDYPEITQAESAPKRTL